jgi:S-adenosylmethionine decarboxylase
MTNIAESVTEIPGFEGPEKRLEVCFKLNTQETQGLRQFTKEQWQEMLNFSACTIISSKHNDFFDAYVLSESSLFVWPFKLMIKTCGTTTLLRIIPTLLKYAEKCNLEIEFVQYSRKNFVFPHVQKAPHTDWSLEVQCLNEHFDGNSYILGPMNGDHWYLYTADYAEPTDETTKETALEIMMHHLTPAAASKFYRKEGTADQDKFPGIAELIPGQDTDEFNFNPCGYSMNGLMDDVYSTIHVTPEVHCSYASFETNWNLTTYKRLIAHVFDVFQPGTVTLSLFADASSRSMDLVEIPGYIMTHKTHSELSSDRDVMLIQYESLTHHNRRNSTTRRGQIRVPISE